MEEGKRKRKEEGKKFSLLDKANQGIDLSGTTVIGGLSITEDLQGGVSTNSKALAELLLLSAINLGNGSNTLQLGGSLLVLGGKAFAVSTPGSIELDQEGAVLGEGSVEAVFSEGEDIRGKDGSEEGNQNGEK